MTVVVVIIAGVVPVNAFNSACVLTSRLGTIVDDEVVIEPTAFWVVTSSVVPKLDWSVVTP